MRVESRTVAFVCSANLCRSPMAQAICAAEVKRRGWPITVLSAGVWDFEGTEAVEGARLTCARHDTPMIKVVSTPFSKVDLAGTARVLVMERTHAATLVAEASLPPEKVTLLGTFDPHQRGDEIDDPTGQEIAAFERCFARLQDCIVHYLDTTRDFTRVSGGR